MEKNKLTTNYQLPTTKPALLVIVGETGSGKSALAMKVAQKFNGEIISADSWSVYKHFDIGTSKPTTTQQKAVKHHLIDVREATDGFNAPLFKELAETAIVDIQKRGKLPILAGGTGLYIDSVLYDFGFLPSVSGDSREELNQKNLNELLNLATTRNIDLSGIDTRNKRRIIRAIEAGGQKPTKKQIRADALVVGISTGPENLNIRIKERVEQMLAGGLEQEVKELAERYGWGAEPMKGIGYREFKEYFEGSQTLGTTKERIVSSSMNLAKRQRTWFKRNPSIQWYSSPAEAYKQISQHLGLID